MRLTHGRLTLELHEIAAGRSGHQALLLLHPLYGSSAYWSEAPVTWPGGVYALDFSGHGCSDWLQGGAYYAELLAADADAALAHIGRAAVVGAGLGAYVALLLAGSRAELVTATLLVPGAGLSGAGPAPEFTAPRLPIDHPLPHESKGAHDPMVRVLDREVRPPEYVEPFARAANRLLLIDDQGPRPPWWQAARRSPRAESAPADLSVAWERLAAISP
ncbi:MAG TPA: alpha/beta hydrolase [Candidatus Binatia bacterium]|nr:alpha/beta hydrolase [Candidatus Binatia bacterium]